MTISPREQVIMNENVIVFGEKLQKLPPTFFTKLTDQQFAICQKILQFVKPMQGDVLNFEEVNELEKIAEYAKNFKPSKVLTFGLTALSYIKTTPSESLYKEVHDKKFVDQLNEFKRLTQILRDKVDSLAKESFKKEGKDAEAFLTKEGVEGLKNLPKELREVILGMTDIKTMNAYKVLSSKTEGRLAGPFFRLDESPIVLKAFAEKLGLDPKDFKNAFSQFLFFNRVKKIHNSTNKYSYDKRFAPLFDNRTIGGLASKGLSEEDMHLIGRWNQIHSKILFWKNACFSIKCSNNEPPEDIIGELEADYDQWKELNIDTIKTAKNFVMYGLTSIPDDILLWESLETLDLSYSDLVNFPEVITELKHLKHLKLGRLNDIPPSITKMYALETIDVTYPVSLDFVVELPNLKKNVCNDPIEVMSPVVSEKLKSRKDLLFFSHKYKTILYNIQEKKADKLSSEEINKIEDLTNRPDGFTLDEIEFLENLNKKLFPKK